MSGISGLRKLAVLAAALAVTHQPAEPLAKSGGPFIGPHGGKWADADVLAAGYAYEQASRKRVAPTYRVGVAP